MTEAEITMYGTRWCGDCLRAKRFLEYHHIPFLWIDIDRDKDAEHFVIETNHGNRSVPTILFEDGSVLVEPSNLQLAEKLCLPV